jgi:YD repeat-containing protein
MLTKVEGPDGTTVELTYDAFARRMKKTVRKQEENGEVRLLRTTRFCWDAMTLAHEIASTPEGESEERTYCFDESGAPWAHRDTGHTGEGPVVGPWLFYLNEAMTGFPERLVDGKGEVAAELFRTAWGKVTSEAAPRHRCAFWGSTRMWRRGSSTTGTATMILISGGTSRPIPRRSTAS